MLSTHNTKEGALNEKLELKKLLTYMNSVYKITRKIKTLTDKRQRKIIPFVNPILIVLVCFILQYQSFHEIFTYQTTRKRIKHLAKGRIPKTDAAREIMMNIDPQELKSILDSMVGKIYENKTFRKGTIDGYTVVALDGVELFSSYYKKCGSCLTREHKEGRPEHFHRSVVCMSVGSDPGTMSRKSTS